jgi:hypothetical protein
MMNERRTLPFPRSSFIVHRFRTSSFIVHHLYRRRIIPWTHSIIPHLAGGDSSPERCSVSSSTSLAELVAFMAQILERETAAA